MIPENVITELADDLESGFKCYVHKRTFEIVSFPEEYVLNDNVEDFEEEMEKVESEPEAYIELEPMGSFDSFKVMQDFVNCMDKKNPLKSKLADVLQGPKPVVNFKKLIHQSGTTREEWFSFRKAKNVQWVREQLNELLVSDTNT
ncbi:MAG: UPF0158 family protein [Candidatus Dadabacteria bacterium]